MENHSQCLIFLIQNHRRSEQVFKNSSFRSGLKGYILLPHSHQNKCPNVSELFLQNSLQIISDEQEFPSTKNVSFEVIEIFLNGNSSNLLTVLAEEHSREIVGSLLGRNASISFVASFGRKSVDFAIGEGNKKVVAHLLNRQADIPYKHSRSGTILHMAVMRGDKVLAELLLKCGANIHAQQNDSATCLHIAAATESVEMVRLLISHGANINKKMDDGRFPLFTAVLRPNTQIVKYLLRNRAEVNAIYTFRDEGFSSCHRQLKGGTPLHAAILRYNVGITRLLLKHGANMDAQCEDGRNCLQLAVDSRKIDIVEEVLNHHPDVNNENNKKSFLASIKRKEAEIVSKMFQYGFGVTPEDASNYDLLLGAVCSNCIGIVKQLLDYGAVVKSCQNDDHRWTLLSMGIECAEKNVVELLLDNGIDLDPKNIHDCRFSHLYFAVRLGKQKIVKLFLDRGVKVMNGDKDVDQFRILFNARHHNEVLEMMLKHGANVNESSCGKATLHYSAEEGDLKIVVTLLKFGAHVNFTKEKNTPLHLAIQGKNRKVFEELLNYCFFSPELRKNLLEDRKYFSGLSALRGGLDILSCYRVKYVCACSVNEKLPPKFSTDFRNSCLEEIDKLKCMKVGNSELTFYAIMFGNLYLVSSFAKNEDVEQTIILEEFKKEFPIYGDIIKWQFWRGYYRRKLLERGIQVCLLLSKRFSGLPDASILLEKILNYLSNRELLCLISDRSIILDPLF